MCPSAKCKEKKVKSKDIFVQYAYDGNIPISYR